MKYLALALIVIFSILIRSYAIGTIPGPLNRDELSLGYTAWSFVETGVDEYGQPLSLNVQSFGDWKLAGYIVAIIPFIKLLGYSTLAIKLPSLISGIAIIVLTSLVTELLMKRAGLKGDAAGTGLLAALIVSISPWAIHFSRVAYEAHLAQALFLTGVYVLLQKSSLNKKIKLKFFAEITGSLLVVTPLFVYHAYQVFIPAVFGTYLIYSFAAKKPHSLLLEKNIVYWLGGFLIFAILFIGVAGGIEANATKVSGLAAFDPATYAKYVNDARDDISVLSGPILLLENKLTLFTETLHKNIWHLLSPEFFFLSGGGNKAHNIHGIGNFYSFMIIGWIAGFYGMFSSKYRHLLRILAIWTVLGFLPGLITLTANHTVRVSASYIPATMFFAVGCSYLWSTLTKKYSKRIQTSTILIFGALVMYGLLFFIKLYFVRAPAIGVADREWHLPLIAQAVERYYSSVDQIYINGETESPYVYLLHYTTLFAPKSAHIIHYPATAEGFTHVQSLNNIYFGPIDWEEITASPESALAIAPAKEVNRPVVESDGWELLEIIFHKHSQVQYEVWKYSPIE